MFLKFRPFEGPVSYTWKDPDTGREFKELSKQALISRIQDYRRQNGLEAIDHLSFVLEAYWCGRPENEGKCEAVERLPRGAMGYVRGGIALLKNLLYKSFASQEKADERAEKCVNCKFNVFPDTEGFIGWSNEIAQVMTEGRRALKHDELGQCTVCSCPLRAKVFYKGKIDIEPQWEQDMKSVDCWQIKERNG